MDKPKKPYVKPTMTIHPAGSPRYIEIMALLEEEKAQEAVGTAENEEMPTRTAK